MELKDLVGEHELSGVDTTTEKVKQYGYYYEDCEVVRFVIDGKTYKAVEDPCDGYRSYLKELEVTDEKVTNNFPPQKVIGKMKDDSDDDYYPYYVLYWSPENLAINAGK
jgi:hypothetical protein